MSKLKGPNDDPAEPEAQGEALPPKASVPAPRLPDWEGGDYSLLDYVASGNVTVPREFRAHKSFFRFLRKAGSDPAVVSELRRLRDAVILSTVREKGHGGLTIGVAGCDGGEGASTLAILLALSLGECVHRKVALLDGRFNVQRFQVLADLLGLSRNSVTLNKGTNEVVGYYNEAHPNVYFLRNAGVERSMQFFSDKRLSPFLSDLRQHFDFTIIDLPPILRDTATLFVVPHLDRLYLVGESGKTHMSKIGKSIQAVRQAGGQLNGVILNKQKTPLWSKVFGRDFFFG